MKVKTTSLISLVRNLGPLNRRKRVSPFDPLNPYRFSRKASDHGHMNGTNKGFK